MSFKSFYFIESVDFPKPNIVNYVGNFGEDKRIQSFDKVLSKTTVFEITDNKIVYGTEAKRVSVSIESGHELEEQIEWETKIYNKTVKEYNELLKHYYDKVYQMNFLNEVDDIRKSLNNKMKAIVGSYLLLKELNSKEINLDEMAKPRDEHKGLWFHGTNKEGYEGIKRDGYLIPDKAVTTKTRSRMAPQHNKVYMTSNVSEAIQYAFFRSESHKAPSEKFGYLIVVDGNELTDIDPDEDIIADLIPLYVKEFNNSWLRNLANQKAPKSLQKYDRYGDYDYGTALGKILIKYLTDEQKYELIEYGKKIAHTGSIKVKEIWKLSLAKFNQDKGDLTEYSNFGELAWENK